MAQEKTTVVDKEQTVEEAFRHILVTNLNAVHEWEPVAVKGEDIEGVHQMRVGLRRMRSALSVFRLAVPRSVARRRLTGSTMAIPHWGMGMPTSVRRICWS